MSEVVDEIRRLSRYRNVVLKSRIMIDNRLVATVATFLGYDSFQSEDDRERSYDQARAVIRSIRSGKEHELSGLVENAAAGSAGFDGVVDDLDKQLVKLAKQLPVAKWALEKDQTGFGLKGLALIVGETGDLANYDSPGKVWRRLGCAPFTSREKTLMGSTWKIGREGKLSAEEWTEFGYSPRRRSVVYVISEALLKSNGKFDREDRTPLWIGPYRARYDQAKTDAIKNRPEWGACECKGSGKTKGGGKCSGCSGKGYKALRAHRHGMLLMGKLLLKNLWIAWNPDLAEGYSWE